MTSQRTRLLLGLLFWLAITFVAAFIGARASIGAPSFYQQLERPDWAPPSSAFGPVWTVLYILMAIAAWLVWRKRGESNNVALTLYIVQLVLNALWTFTFFKWQSGALAFGVIVALWLLIIATLLAFWRTSRPAGALLVPYLLWVTYAAALTWSLWRLNTALLSG